MKKTNILIAALAVIVAASTAKAQMDFDGTAQKTSEFSLKASIMENGLQHPIPFPQTPDPTDTDPKPNTVIGLAQMLDNYGLRKFEKDILKIPEIPNNFIEQALEKKAEVLYTNENAFFVIYVGGIRYLIAETGDKQLIELFKNHKATLVHSAPQNKNLVYACITRLETIMKWINYVWVAVEVSREVCSWQNDGTTPSTGNPGGSGGTYHNGQGGDSNYDVNKALK